MINNFISQVAEFHDAFGVKRGNVDVELRYKLFKEEFEEYLEGYEAKQKGLEFFTTKQGQKVNTFVYMVDAICDKLYIACGDFDLFHWDSSKLNEELEFELKYDNLIAEFLNLEGIKNGMKMFLEQKSRFSKESIILNIYDLARHNNVLDILPELFTEVHKSNLSKLDDNGKPIINELDSPHYDPRKPIGKILKSDKFFEPDLESILKKHNKI